MAVATVLVRVDVMVMALLAVLAVLAVLGFSCCNAECKLRPGALVSSAGATATERRLLSLDSHKWWWTVAMAKWSQMAVMVVMVVVVRVRCG